MTYSIQRAGTDVINLYTGLAPEARRAGSSHYHLVRKVHPFLHDLDDLALDKLNPWHFSAWVDESFMRFVMDMARDKQRQTLPESVLRGWALSFLERLRGSAGDP